MKGETRIWPILVWAVIGIAILCGLGVWQIFRLAEKETLLARIAARQTAQPMTLSEALQRGEKDDDIEFAHVKSRGTFDHAHERQKLTVFEGEPGWEIITPFTSDEGVVALVDRGAVPDNLRDSAKRPESPGPVEIQGVVRAHGAAQGYFDPPNDVENNRWYWWDIPAMLASVAIPADAKVAPFILQALPAGDLKAFPRASAPQAGLRNNHLQYAVTWFSLALVLAVIAFLFVRKMVRTSDA
jgi:surfeit locus 1 family protein